MVYNRYILGKLNYNGLNKKPEIKIFPEPPYEKLFVILCKIKCNLYYIKNKEKV